MLTTELLIEQHLIKRLERERERDDLQEIQRGSRICTAGGGVETTAENIASSGETSAQVR